jgi:hypothetical protein
MTVSSNFGFGQNLKIPLTGRTAAVDAVLRWGAAKFVHEAPVSVL